MIVCILGVSHILNVFVCVCGVYALLPSVTYQSDCDYSSARAPPARRLLLSEHISLSYLIVSEVAEMRASVSFIYLLSHP